MNRRFHFLRGRIGRSRVVHGLAYLLAFLLPPLLVGGATFAVKLRAVSRLAPPLSEPLPAAPVHDPAKRTAVVLAGLTGTESTDFLGPYEVLAASGAFNVYALAPERRQAPLEPDLDIIPHYSLAEYDRTFGVDPDVIVVPYIPRINSPEDAPILSWIKRHAGPRTIVLSICGGALVTAESGVLAGRSAITHHNIRPLVTRAHPEVRWLRDVRYVEDGNFISSAGVTSGIDATLRTITRLAGRNLAEEVARTLDYPHLHYQDDPREPQPAFDVQLALLKTAFRWDTTQTGMLLYEGVGELEVASIIDTYPRSGAARIQTVTPERSIVRSRHGLPLVPRWSFADAPALDRVLVPGREAGNGDVAGVEAWAQRRYGLRVEYIHRDAQAGAYSYDATLRDMTRSEPIGVVAEAARGLEYPVEHLRIAGRAWPWFLVRPVALGLAGLGLTIALRRRRTSQGVRTAGVSKQPAIQRGSS